jgi:hypothetical protein
LAATTLNAGSETAAAAAVAATSQAGHGPQQQQQWVLDFAQTGVGPGGIQALASLPGLQQLSLFGCKLGGSGSESAGEGRVTQGARRWG